MDILFGVFKTFFLKKLQKDQSRIEKCEVKEELDGTGLLLASAERIDVHNAPSSNVLFPLYTHSLAHSYWRAQEITIFGDYLKKTSGSVLDFGCGDGSLASCFTDHMTFGVDIDDAALEVAKNYKIYDLLLKPEEMKEKIGTDQVDHVMSCSVLEHTADVDLCLRQIYDVLKPNGDICITVPNQNFHNHLAALGDDELATLMNKHMFHRNLFTEEVWREKLHQAGFQNIKIKGFQPQKFTRKYCILSLFGNGGLGRIPFVRKLAQNLLLNSLVDDVKQSITNTDTTGANFILFATK